MHDNIIVIKNVFHNGDHAMFIAQFSNGPPIIYTQHKLYNSKQ